MLCAHLAPREASRALAGRALLAAAVPGQSTLALFVEILNAYVLFVGAGADKIKPQYVAQLVSLINEQLASSARVVDPPTERYYRATLALIRDAAAHADAEPEGSGGRRFAELRGV